MSRLDAFEQQIRTSLENFEVPYNSADWAKMEEQLDKQTRGSGFATSGLFLGLLAGSLLIGSVLYVTLSNNEGSGNGNEMAQTVVPTLPSENDDNKTGPTQSTSDNGVRATDGLSADLSVDPSIGSSSENGLSASSNISNEDESRSERGPRYATAELGSEKLNKVQAEQPGEFIHKRTTAAGSKDQASARNKALDAGQHSDHEMHGRTGSRNSTDVSFSASSAEGCAGTTIEFMVDNMPEEGIYLWNFGDGSFSNKPNPSHTFDKAGSYSVMLSLTSASGGPILSRAATDKIVIYDAPKAVFVSAHRSEPAKIPYVHFENSSRNATSSFWKFGDGTTSSAMHPDHIYRKQGNYQVELTVQNKNGCMDKVVHEIVVTKDYDLNAPKSFSPNGDGLKDTFMPEALKELKAPFNLSIYETTGKLLYATTDAKHGWNGRVNNSDAICEPGEYVWVVEFLGGAYEGESFDGKTTLLN